MNEEIVNEVIIDEITPVEAEESISMYEGFLQVQAANKVDIRTGFKGSVATIYKTFMEAADYVGGMVFAQCDDTDSIKSNCQIQTEQGSVHSFQFVGNVRDYDDKMEEMADKLEYVADIDFHIAELSLMEDEDDDCCEEGCGECKI